MRDWLSSQILNDVFERTNKMKRVVSNIQNLGYTITNNPNAEANGKQKAAGMIIDQTLVNGASEGVSIRLINGKQKSAAVKLDRFALTNLLEAVNEVLSTEE
ncbi:MAG: hypothetical protein CMF52_06960 [Legionellales bacterium]|nr:hypothetical protein [Legionellales bacterium]|tara:strand:+ start:5012 stop:5317 length:306 start_codon:yes stop_codon:yes gene_type:complete